MLVVTLSYNVRIMNELSACYRYNEGRFGGDNNSCDENVRGECLFDNRHVRNNTEKFKMIC